MAVVPDESITTFFPEPAVDDPTWAKAREGMARWLERSTLPRARAFRQFLNQNLARGSDGTRHCAGHANGRLLSRAF